MSTVVQYNGVTLTNVTTRGCEQQLVYDQEGHDLAGEKVALVIECIVHAQQLNALLHGAGLNVNAMTATAQMREVQRRLSEPRAQLLMTVNGEILYKVDPANSLPNVLNNPDVDVDAGPKPRSVRIAAIMGNQAFKIAWTVEFQYGYCPTTYTRPHVVVYNKWTTSEARDANFFTTRTISGHIRFSSRWWPAHSYLHYCVPGLEYGFKRESVQFDADDSGLEARYVVTDRQVHTAAPWPATSISGAYSWSTNLETGQWIHSAQFQLEGGPDADVSLLVGRAIELCDARVKYLEESKEEKSANKILTEAQITENVGEANSVSVSFTVKLNPINPTALFANLAKDQIGAEIKLKPIQPYPGADPEDAVPYDVGKSRVPALYGYVPRQAGPRDPSLLFLMHCYQQDPCSPVKSVYKFPRQEGENEGDEKSERIETSMSQLPPGTLDDGDMGLFDSEKQKAIYTYVRLSSEYRTTQRRTQMSLAKRRGDVQTPDTATIRWGAPMTRRFVRYEAERQDDWPDLPDFVDVQTINGIKHALLDHSIETPAPKTSADGMHLVYHVVAWAVYACDRAPGLKDKLAAPKIPFITKKTELDLNTHSDSEMLG